MAYLHWLLIAVFAIALVGETARAHGRLRDEEGLDLRSWLVVIVILALIAATILQQTGNLPAL